MCDIRYYDGRKYHFVDPQTDENALICTFVKCDNLEGNPNLRFYIYVDEQFVYKSKIYSKSHSPELNLDVDL